MLTQDTKQIPDVAEAPDASKASKGKPAKEKRLKSGPKFDWAMALISFWLVGGIHVDGWAHQNLPGMESFFTPWHALFYSAFLSCLAFLSLALLNNHARGFPWTRALPKGYGLSFIGVIIFLVGGVADMLWHTLLGIEVSIEALLSPSHLTLALGGFLIVSGPLRACWLKGSTGLTFFSFLPALISTAMALSVLTFFTQYAHPMGSTWAAAKNATGNFRTAENINSLGIVSTILQSALLSGMVLLLIRRWNYLPFGSLAFLFTLNITLEALMRARVLATGSGMMIVVGLFGGLSADLLLQKLKPSIAKPFKFRLFATLIPAVVFALYFIGIALADGMGWRPSLWAGAIILGGVAGLLLSLVALPPALPADNLTLEGEK